MNLREQIEKTYDLASADPSWLQMLEVACATEQTIRELEDLVRSDGLLSTGSKQQTVIHPAVVELRQQRAAFARLLSQLGLENERETFRQRQSRYARQRWEK